MTQKQSVDPQLERILNNWFGVTMGEVGYITDYRKNRELYFKNKNKQKKKILDNKRTNTGNKDMNCFELFQKYKWDQKETTKDLKYPNDSDLDYGI